jgi:hypothetical protein
LADDLPAKLTRIAGRVTAGDHRYTVHAARQVVLRQVTDAELREALGNGEIIEDYPNHHYGPCCLILGRTRSGRSLRLVCSDRAVVDIITVYEPDPSEWEADLRTRWTSE